MIKEFTIKKVGGLKSEDCAVIAQQAGLYASEVYLVKDNKRVNAKSIMGVIALALKSGDVAYLSVSGIDEDICLYNMTQLLEKL